MSQEPMQLGGAEQELEAALGRLSPAPAEIDRDRLLFEAGRRAGRVRAWPWRITTAAAALAAAVLGALLAARPAPDVRIVERIVEVPVAAPAARPVAAADNDELDATSAEQAERIRHYVRLRDRMLKRGAASLPARIDEPSTGTDAHAGVADPRVQPFSRHPLRFRRTQLPRWLTGES